MLERGKIESLLSATLTGSFQWAEQVTPMAITIHVNDLVAVGTLLHQNPTTYFDQLSCITGIDNGPSAGTMEVIYTLYSIPFNESLQLKVTVDRNNPVVDSVVSIWKSANWMEREVFDLYGIQFSNHPDLRRILMPADWQGYPLRKDYQEQETYRNITLAPES